MTKDERRVWAIVGGVVLCGGAMWGMIEVHAQHPHEGSVSRDEIDGLRRLIQQEHESIRREIRLVLDAER